MASAADLIALRDAVYTALKKRLDGGAVDSFKIGDQDVSSTPIPDLVALKREIEADIERVEGGGGSRFLRLDAGNHP